MKVRLYKDHEGNTLYPVCKWEPNQHKLYNALDRAYLKMVDAGYDESATTNYEEVQGLLEAFNTYVINGLVYATYETGQKIKEIIVAYDCRGDELRYAKEEHNEL